MDEPVQADEPVIKEHKTDPVAPEFGEEDTEPYYTEEQKMEAEKERIIEEEEKEAEEVLRK